MITNPRFDLEGRAVIITGGGKGIGKVYAQEFARAGARVLAADIDGAVADAVAKEIRAAGGDAVSTTTDISEPAHDCRMIAGRLQMLSCSSDRRAFSSRP